jgi:hypothetical protein
MQVRTRQVGGRRVKGTTHPQLCVRRVEFVLEMLWERAVVRPLQLLNNFEHDREVARDVDLVRRHEHVGSLGVRHLILERLPQLVHRARIPALLVAQATLALVDAVSLEERRSFGIAEAGSVRDGD